jgi:hypothetical protein
VVAVETDVSDARRGTEARPPRRPPPPAAAPPPATPSTIPSPARRMGTSVSFLPLTRMPVVRSNGVSTGAGSRGSSLVAS